MRVLPTRSIRERNSLKDVWESGSAGLGEGCWGWRVKCCDGERSKVHQFTCMYVCMCVCVCVKER